MAKDIFSDDILNDAISANQLERKKAREEKYRKRDREAEKRAIAAENFKKRSKFYVVALIVFILAGAIFGKSFIQIRELQKQKEEAQAKLDELNVKIEKLQDELTRVTSPEYIEQQARNQLRMIYPGETLYVIMDKNK